MVIRRFYREAVIHTALPARALFVHGTRVVGGSIWVFSKQNVFYNVHIRNLHSRKAQTLQGEKSFIRIRGLPTAFEVARKLGKGSISPFLVESQVKIPCVYVGK